MKAHVGDWLVINGRVLHTPVRTGRIIEVRNVDGTPPYLVEWLDSDHPTLVFPGPDAHVETAESRALTHAAKPLV